MKLHFLSSLFFCVVLFVADSCAADVLVEEMIHDKKLVIKQLEINKDKDKMVETDQIESKEGRFFFKNKFSFKYGACEGYVFDSVIENKRSFIGALHWEDQEELKDQTKNKDERMSLEEYMWTVDIPLGTVDEKKAILTDNEGKLEIKWIELSEEDASPESGYFSQYILYHAAELVKKNVLAQESFKK